MKKIREIVFMGLRLKISGAVYEPSDDTEILAKAALSLVKSGEKILEIGCGAGAISILLAKKGCKVMATDISKEAVEITKINAKINNVHIDIRWGDLFEPVEDKFDVIIFNPPYLPKDDLDILIPGEFKKSIIGGEKGNEIVIRFIENMPRYLKREGYALIVLSSLSKIEEVLEKIKRYKMKYEIVMKKKFFFEEIYVLKISF
ncbi:MAG: HemK2/MTQ2 family protein methyltransferase [Candidatus Njordarchaeota archaeon]